MQKNLKINQIEKFFKKKFEYEKDISNFEDSLIKFLLPKSVLSEDDSYMEYYEAISIVELKKKNHPKYPNAKSFVIATIFNEYSYKYKTQDLEPIFHLIEKDIFKEKIYKYLSVFFILGIIITFAYSVYIEL